ncbi:MAG TPA: ATPase [Prolixibacteraceae bacterium]|nr:ATPase [Prolixibacteraceae bacterium]
MIKREIEALILSKFFKGKTIILLGARQVGKSSLLKQIEASINQKVIWLNADNPEVRIILNQLNGNRAKEIFPKGSIIFIDEAQRLENSGLTLKIIHDNCEEFQMIATGSSSFELSDKIKEAMTGRKWSYSLFPISYNELYNHSGAFETFRNLETRLIYGSYPEVINHPGNEKEILHELMTDYLYKDIFMLKDVRKPDAIENLLKALAFQVGNQVSYRELSQLVGIDKETIEKYIYLLEEAFIIFRLGSFSRNLRNELKHSRKIYFVDNGIRNALINRFSPTDLRDDTGALWENYLISERRKKNEYTRSYKNTYFWRTTFQQEIDYIEESDGKINAFEFKWGEKPRFKVPAPFTTTYPEAEVTLITRENYTSFLM